MFDYMISKIAEAKFVDVPFRHVYVDNFLSDEHFAELLRAPEISIPIQRNDHDLFEALFKQGYQILDFPGCISDKNEYIKWHSNKKINHRVSTSCEGFGVTLRLTNPRTGILAALKEFLAGEKFNAALAEKFGVPYHATTTDSGIQKYLDGYEISPHPDIRRKALTYMVNVNPHSNADKLQHHTHYLRFKPEYQYVRSFWEGNPRYDTCWVPWDWCETVSLQTKNNSVVLFAPSCSTLHGIKTAYNHLGGQRTQLYGNLWYKNQPALEELIWEDLDMHGRVAPKQRQRSFRDLAASVIPQTAKGKVKTLVFRSSPLANVTYRNTRARS